MVNKFEESKCYCPASDATETTNCTICNQPQPTNKIIVDNKKGKKKRRKF